MIGRGLMQLLCLNPPHQGVCMCLCVYVSVCVFKGGGDEFHTFSQSVGVKLSQTCVKYFPPPPCLAYSVTLHSIFPPFFVPPPSLHPSLHTLRPLLFNYTATISDY